MSPVRDAVGRLRATVARSGFPWRSAPVPTGIEPPPPSKRLGADYDTSWARRYPARVARAAIVESVMRPAMAALASPDRRGLDRLDDLDGPVVFVANHHSHADTPLLLTSIPEPWRHRGVVGAAADYFFGNADGTLDPEELYTVAFEVNMIASSIDDDLFDTLDADGSGTFTQAEFDDIIEYETCE